MNSNIATRIVATMLGMHAAFAAAGDDARADFERERSAVASIQKALGMHADDAIFEHDFDKVVAPVAIVTCANPASDRDADRLADCFETASGRYTSRQNTGTSPDNPDTDGDGILDGDEVLGSAAGLDLPALGTNPLRRDILIEYDWFDLPTSECGPLSHRPQADAIARVTAMFAAAPVRNADGSTGINVIHDFGQGGAASGGNLVAGYSALLPGTFDATHAAIKAANFDAKRLGYFRYVLMAHRYNGTSSSSGYAETIGDDVLVTLQCAKGAVTVGNTIAHELGHNLGLRHGGFEGCNRKPNYNSIMNYRYQFSGVDSACGGVAGAANFSSGTHPALDESALDETKGVCGSAPLDWNTDGTLESAIAHDLNPQHAATCGGALTKLEDFDDWSNLTYAGLLDKHGLLEKIQTEAECAPAPGADGKST